jgi:hypothetical protein
MNTIFGNFLERIIPNLKKATLKLNISGHDAEMTVEDFKSAIVPAPVETPYKIYRALLTQQGGNAPVVTVLENTLGTIVWSYLAPGLYLGTLNGAFPINKYFAFLAAGGFDTGPNNGGSGNPYYYSRLDDNSVAVNSVTDDKLINSPIEIIVYN